jgi:phage tail-like protein
MSDNHFVPAFHFRVLFTGLSENAAADAGFQSITGLKIITDNSGTAPAGDKKLPVQFNPIVLKRAISQQQPSPLRQWVLQSLNGRATPALPEIQVQVLNDQHHPAIALRLTHVTAAGWQLGPLDTLQSELLMEEITLQYRSIEWLEG